jgi:hypothetical protein
MVHHTAIGTSDHVLPVGLSVPHAEWPLRTLHTRPAALSRRSSYGAPRSFPCVAMEVA